MKKIIKQSEPRSLVKHRSKQRANQNADYENYPEKDDLRKSLLEEQGYICCYCMSRITSEQMKIEHWKPQTKYTSLQLDYRNLLGACKGGEGSRLQKQHCDTRKGESEITVNPIEGDKNCENLIRYRPDGEIYSTDESINLDLNKTLNLNLEFLKKNRKVALDVVLDQLRKKFPNTTWTANIRQKVINDLSDKDANGYYSEYCQIAIWYLKYKL
jgi:uncharacterized protein (TIGR02646 family)